MDSYLLPFPSSHHLLPSVNFYLCCLNLAFTITQLHIDGLSVCLPHMCSLHCSQNHIYKANHVTSIIKKQKQNQKNFNESPHLKLKMISFSMVIQIHHGISWVSSYLISLISHHSAINPHVLRIIHNSIYFYITLPLLLLPYSPEMPCPSWCLFVYFVFCWYSASWPNSSTTHFI